MILNDSETRIKLSTILYLTDFSAPSEAALPFVLSLARNYESAVRVLHVLTPPLPSDAAPQSERVVALEEEFARTEMARLDSQLSSLPHELTLEWDTAVWPRVEEAIQVHKPDLLILGTHGRTGKQKLLLGSVAEQIFRRSPVPVLTIGPRLARATHNNGQFRAILLATDFGSESAGATRYAISLSEENQARLLLLHVLRGQRQAGGSELVSAAEVMHRLYEVVPSPASLWCRPEPVVEYGDPGKAVIADTKGRDGGHKRRLLAAKAPRSVTRGSPIEASCGR